MGNFTTPSAVCTPPKNTHAHATHAVQQYHGLHCYNPNKAPAVAHGARGQDYYPSTPYTRGVFFFFLLVDTTVEGALQCQCTYLIYKGMGTDLKNITHAKVCTMFFVLCVCFFCFMHLHVVVADLLARRLVEAEDVYLVWERRRLRSPENRARVGGWV